jgi:CheY-like chemotaxis protein
MVYELSENLLKNWTILVIDDEADSLFVAEKLLEIYGATVLTATNGRAGLALAQQEAGSLKFIICDLSMPIMDGWDFIKAFREDSSISSIPTVALTAHAMEGDREKVLAAGFHSYLSKPLFPETFVPDVLDLLLDIPEIANLLNNKQE